MDKNKIELISNSEMKKIEIIENYIDKIGTYLYLKI